MEETRKLLYLTPKSILLSTFVYHSKNNEKKIILISLWLYADYELTDLRVYLSLN